ERLGEEAAVVEAGAAEGNGDQPRPLAVRERLSRSSSGGERLDHHLLHRFPGREHRVLWYVTDPRPLASDPLAGVGLLAAGDDAEERGLAGAVRADQTDVITGGEREVQAFEDGAAAEGLGDGAEGDERSGRPGGPAAAGECTAQRASLGARRLRCGD